MHGSLCNDWLSKSSGFNRNQSKLRGCVKVRCICLRMLKFESSMQILRSPTTGSRLQVWREHRASEDAQRQARKPQHTSTASASCDSRATGSSLTVLIIKDIDDRGLQNSSEGNIAMKKKLLLNAESHGRGSLIREYGYAPAPGADVETMCQDSCACLILPSYSPSHESRKREKHP